MLGVILLHVSLGFIFLTCIMHRVTLCPSAQLGRSGLYVSKMTYSHISAKNVLNYHLERLLGRKKPFSSREKSDILFPAPEPTCVKMCR